MPVSDYDPLFQAAGAEWNVDPTLLKAIAQQESGGDARAISPKSAAGIMGIMPDTAKYLGVTDATAPAQSIFGGAKYLRQMLDRYGDPQTAVAAYNAGPGRIDQVLAGKATLPNETAAYVPSVSAAYQRYSAGATQPASANTAQVPSDVLARAAPVEDDSAFLARTAKPAGGAPSSEADSAFLTRTGAKPAPPVDGAIKPASPVDGAAKPAVQPISDADMNAQQLAGAARIAAATGQGAASGFGSEPLGLSEQSRARLAQLGIFDPPGQFTPLRQINQALIGGLAAGGDLILRGANAALGGYQGGISQLGEEIGSPSLGRDLAALPEAFPTGDVQGGTRLAAPRNHLSPPADAALPGKPTLLTAPGDIPTVEIHPSDAAEAPAAGPSPGMGAPAPQPAGAQASTAAEAMFTPQETSTYRQTAEGQKLVEGQRIGEADRSVYVPGVQPNAAEQEQTVAMARELKSLGIASSEASQEAKAAAQANNDARVAYWQNTAGSKIDIGNETAKMEADINAAKPAVFAEDNIKAPVSLAPAVQQIDDLLQAKINRQNTPMQTVLSQLRARLVDDDDAPRMMDPEEAWGLRQDIDRLTDKRMTADDPNLHYVGHALNGVSDLIDQSIEDQAPGYRDMLDTYKNHKAAIAEMRVLQDAEVNGGLFRGPNRQMNYNDFQRFMKNVVDARMSGATDLNDYKAISDATMARLWNLRDDLRRSAGALELARAAGSDTMPNLVDFVKQYAKLGGVTAVHGIANAISPGWGSLVVGGLQRGYAPFNATRIARKQMQRARNLLYPPNALTDPTQD